VSCRPGRSKASALAAAALVALAAACALNVSRTARAQRAAGQGEVVRVAVIGGMTMTGLWQAVSAMFEQDTGVRVDTVATGERPLLSEAMRTGAVDVLTMHSGDITTNLVADGYGRNMRPWARNDLVIVGPPSDPAGIAGMSDGVEAVRRIAATQAPFLDCRDIGAREVAHTLWARAGITPIGDWVISDRGETNRSMVLYAEAHGAYVIVGRMPILAGKMPVGGMRIMVDQDPGMRRPYIVMEANPLMCPGVNAEGAKALVGYLLSDKVQAFLDEYGKDDFAGVCPFHPVAPAARH
jgi:tungstate transport system substrate-binding protein